ncbi:MAG TPA: hypothetical protein EYP36_01450 [Calditrichaeota bacterium]|nr:hypothetical protein [Calditrichota bacterium]
MTKYAVIDIGSFSVLLLIAETDSAGNIYPMQEHYKITRLGDNVAKTGRLNEAAIERTLEKLEEYRKIVTRNTIAAVYLLGSEALRRAENSAELSIKIKERFGWDLEILDAEEEAQFSYRGAVSGLPHLPNRCCVIDVGGGSCEFCVGQGMRVETMKSIAVGAASLYEKSGRKRTLCSAERLELSHFVKLLLQENGINELLMDAQDFIVCGGTITTLAAIKRQLTVYTPAMVNGLALSRKELWDMYFALNAQPIRERKKNPGLEAGRERVVLFGALIILTLMEWLHIEYIRVSDRGLRYGYLQNKLLKMR